MGMRGGQSRSKKTGNGRMNLWLSENPSKTWGEVFFLKYTPFWLTLCLGIIVPFKLYEFPYYEFVDRDAMYTVGSLFYAIYFFVSFPMFLRIDENPNERWSLWRVSVDALGAAMLVTIILDLWRIFLGPIVLIPDRMQHTQSGLPWFS